MKTKSKALLLALCAVLLVVASVFGTLAYLTDTTDVVNNTFTVGQVHIILDEKNVDNDENTRDDKTYLIGESNETEIRDQANEYHLLPGQSYEKDPTVTVLEDSEDSYVRMIVTVKKLSELKNAIPQYEEITTGEGEDATTTQVEIEKNKKYYTSDGKFLIQYLVSGWDNNDWISTTEIIEDTTNDTATYEFRFKEIVSVKATSLATYLTKVTEVKTDAANETIGYALPALFEKVVVPGDLDNDAIAHLSNVTIDVQAHAIQSTGFVATEDKTAVENAWAAFDAQMNG